MTHAVPAADIAACRDRLVAEQKAAMGSWCLPTGLPENPLETCQGWSPLFVELVAPLPALEELLDRVTVARRVFFLRPRILLVGPTGCGKSYTLHQLGRDEPMCYLDFSCHHDGVDWTGFGDVCIHAFYQEFTRIIGASARVDPEHDALEASVLRLLLAKLVLWKLVPLYYSLGLTDASTFLCIQQSSWGKAASAAVFTATASWPEERVRSVTELMLQSFPLPIVVSVDEGDNAREWFAAPFAPWKGESRGALCPLVCWLATVDVVLVLAGTSVALLKAAPFSAVSPGLGKPRLTTDAITNFVPLSPTETSALLCRCIDAGTAAGQCAAQLAGKGRYVEAFIWRLRNLASPPDTPEALVALAAYVRHSLVAADADRLTSKPLRTTIHDAAASKHILCSSLLCHALLLVIPPPAG